MILTSTSVPFTSRLSCPILAEDHIIEKYVKPAVLQNNDLRKFGTIPKSSTTHALVNMTHNYRVNSDGSGATARVVLLDPP